MSTTADSPTWRGWHRSDASRPWLPLIEAEGEDEALVLLLCTVAGGDCCVLPSGKDPNQPRGVLARSPRCKRGERQAQPADNA
jgi:hypothetical protein